RRPEVVLWPDTFNNHFFPHTAIAAVEVLESAGYRVRVPEQHLCCGRPLYDYGLLDQAKKHLLQILSALQPQITAGTPVVCLEPSCASVFRDELTNMLSKNEDAYRLREQTFVLSDFLARVDYRVPVLKRNALVHGHCHQKAIFDIDSETNLLKRMGIKAELLDSGCCGLAGSFGYEEGHYDVSMKIGERVLLPRVRSAGSETLIVADGFSCREQIEHGTKRRGMHLAEVIQMALHQPLPPRKSKYVEAGFVQERPSYPVMTATAGAGMLLAGGLYLLSRKNAGGTPADTPTH
ncbi:MAG TPA: heterodisulfide reductase-related iron-sulfur binding cluster, partial [Bryobacteraceae bacterium]|nr:heterodisulfide reductase-related iron-sulfur binding cluster [Bryobacteraceae bacterium]